MATEKRLIDACALNRNIDCCCFESMSDYMTICEQIIEAPTVDAVEVVHGRWIEYKDFMECSECHSNWWYGDNDCYLFDYCPNCGAKMDGDGNG